MLYCFGVRTIAPEEKCPPIRDRAWVMVRVGRRFSSGAIVLEPSAFVSKYYSQRMKIERI